MFRMYDTNLYNRDVTCLGLHLDRIIRIPVSSVPRATVRTLKPKNLKNLDLF